MAVLERLNKADSVKFAGKWVAMKKGRALFGADSPVEVSRWLNEKHESADLVFRVPAKDEPTNWVY